MHNDKLQILFDLRKQFMKALQEAKPGSYPKWPVNIAAKEAQQALRDTALKGIEEMFEALQHLKNWKPHKKTETSDFDRANRQQQIIYAIKEKHYFVILTKNKNKQKAKKNLCS